MTDETLTAARVDDAAMRQIDAKYSPFPAFSAWVQLDVPLKAWDEQRTELVERRAKLGEDALREPVRKAMQAAAADTGAIEGLYAHDRGFTISVATEMAAWEVGLSKKTADIRALLEAQLLGYELALDAATTNTPVSEAWIRRLHEVLTGAQEDHEVYVWVRDQLVRQRQRLSHGEYKRFPNHVRLPDGSFHSYAPVSTTSDEMRRLVTELASAEFESAHPVLQAAYAHYGLAAIHPFADGNGRVARALASVYLMRATSVPLVLFYEQKDVYLESLAAADGGRPEPFVRLIRDASIDGVRIVADQLRPGPEKYTRELEQLLTVPGGLPYPDLVEAALGLIPEIHGELDRQFAALGLPRGINHQVQLGSGGVNYTVKGYQQATRPNRDQIYVSLQSSTPATGTMGHIAVFVGAGDLEEPVLVVWDAIGKKEYFRVRSTDVHPGITPALRARVASWIRALLGELTADLVRRVSDIHARGEAPQR